MSPSQLAVVTVTHNSSQVIEGWIDALEETGRRWRMELCVVCGHAVAPEVAEAGLRFLRAIGLRGMAYAEFKRDSRDGELKLIECNHPFVNSRSCCDEPTSTSRCSSTAVPPDSRLRPWRAGAMTSPLVPLRDWRAARDYRREPELTWPRWVRSLARRRVYTPVLALVDSRPVVGSAWRKASMRLLRRS